MKAIARRSNAAGLAHRIEIGRHQLVADERPDKGGDDDGPCPQELLAASLAACTAITMEMYAKRKGWELGQVEVECEYIPAERGCPTKFTLALRFPSNIEPERAERLAVIAARCPVHRTLDGEVMFEQHVELVEPAAT